MKTDNLFESTFLEQYIMTPNYPDDYPNNYDQVILQFPCFPHDAQYSRHGHWSQQPGNISHSLSQHLILMTAMTGWRSMTAPPPSATVAKPTVAPVTVAPVTTVAPPAL